MADSQDQKQELYTLTEQGDLGFGANKITNPEDKKKAEDAIKKNK
jgi:hypothetical protein